jgi:uncharacterized protein YyaL (SSP411 family)
MAQASQVTWREWGQEAFAEAAEKDRPVLLSISAVWCHWCHVMDRTTYQDPEVIERIGDRFVPVRVDNDRRPDVNSRYNMGGWPTTAFLTPEGEILTGATYLPAETMRALLDRVATFYAEHREDIRQEVAGRKRTAPPVPPAPPVLPAEAPAGLEATEALSAAGEVARGLAEAYDPDHGGFGVQPKFPQPKALEYLLVTYLRDAAHGDPQRARWAGRHLEMVETTLRGMARGGMYDHVAGGFFRYSTTRDWSVPHYEKMLEDNAQLLAIYARMARLGADPVYLDTVRDVVRYLEDWLRSDDGYFYGSQDADEAYYALDAAGREERRDTAPRVDRTLYSGWNALAASGLLEAYLATRDVRLRELGLVALEYAWAATRVPAGSPPGPDLSDADTLPAHWHDEAGPHEPVLLEDTSRFASAFLDAFEATGDAAYLDRAKALAGAAERAFFDAEEGAFRDALPTEDALGHLQHPRLGLQENAGMALVLLRLSETTGDPHPGEVARRALGRFLGPHRRYGTMAAEYALALDRAAGPTAEVTITGEDGGPNDQASFALSIEAVAAVSAARSVRWPEASEAQAGSPAGPAPGSGAATGPSARICSGQRCLAPIGDPAGLAVAVRDAAERGREPAAPPAPH